MSDFRIDQITNQAGTAGPDIAGITTFSGSSGLLMPSGATEYRGGRGRGIFGGGNTGSIINAIDYITISTLSNSYDFGDLNVVNSETGTFASSTHGFFAGGLNPSVLSSISRVTISSTGNAFTFGELDATRWGGGGLSNSTRGIYGRGVNPAATGLAHTYSTQYLNMSSGGKTSYFGELLDNALTPGVCASPVRGLFAGGGTPNINNIEYITITTLGNGIDFGDLAIGGSRRRLMGLSNSIRGIFAGGYLGAPAATNAIEYVTLSSLGDTTDFGDLTKAVYSAGSCASSTRGIICSGYDTGSAIRTNTIQYITISSTGNAQNFGELTSAARTTPTGCSDAHGGLGD